MRRTFGVMLFEDTPVYFPAFHAGYACRGITISLYGAFMFKQSCLLLTLIIAAIPGIASSGPLASPIHFKVTNSSPRSGRVENIHASCIAEGNSSDLLCSMAFSSLEYSQSNTGQAQCEVQALPIEPMRFKQQTGGVWQYTSSPNLLCGMVSTYTLSRVPGKPEFFGWTLTIQSKETDLKCVASMKRAPMTSLTTYSFGGSSELRCDHLSFDPGAF